MARPRPGTSFSATLTAAPDMATLVANYIEARLLAASWVVLDDLTVGSYDKVFLSRGDTTLGAGAGDAIILIRIKKFDNFSLDFVAYQDWCPATHTGTRPSSALGDANTRYSAASVTIDADVFGMVDRYEFSMFIRQKPAPVLDIQMHIPPWLISFGSPWRRHIKSCSRGIAFSTAPTIAGPGTVIPVDRDLRIGSALLGNGVLVPGETNVWVYDVSVGTGALAPDATETVTVTAVGPASITVASTANNHPGPCIIGRDPCPVYVYAERLRYPPTQVTPLTPPAPYCVFTNAADGSYFAPSAIEQQFAFAPLSAGLLSAWNASLDTIPYVPLGANQFIMNAPRLDIGQSFGMRIGLSQYDTDPPGGAVASGFRGIMGHAVAWVPRYPPEDQWSWRFGEVISDRGLYDYWVGTWFGRNNLPLVYSDTMTNTEMFLFSLGYFGA